MIAAISIDGRGKGYIRLHRKILDNPVFKDKPPGWLKIWIFILLSANWRERVFRPREGKPIVVPTGSLVTSLEKLGTHAGLTKEHARRCLEYLERTRSVTLWTTRQWTMVTITNWATYQLSTDDEHHSDHHNSQHGESRGATHETPHRSPRAATPSKEVKNLNKNHTSNSDESDSDPVINQRNPKRTSSKQPAEIDPIVREWFDVEFWPLYPRHEGKQPALIAANAKATTTEKRDFYIRRLKDQLPEYRQRKTEGGQRVIPMAATWFNQDRAEDELELRTPRGPGRTSPQGDYPEYVPFAAGGRG